MKTIFCLLLFVLTIIFISCGNDDTVSCISCNSSQTIQFEICEERDGNASINGEDTGTPYATYLEGLIAAGTSCGE